MSVEGLAASFGSAAAEYERGRPDYPREAIDRLSLELGLGRGATVVDLAAGTGKLTRDLVPRFGRVMAVEPLDQMRAELERALPSVEALRGTAEEIPIGADSVDAVMVAQAFHWFDGDRALAEIARVLRPGGGLGLLWNLSPWEFFDDPAAAPGWFEALDDLLEHSRADLTEHRRHASGAWMAAFEGDRPFEPLAASTFSHSQSLPRRDFLAALASRSYIAVLSTADRTELLADVNALLDRDDGPIENGALVLPLKTLAFWTRLRPDRR